LHENGSKFSEKVGIFPKMDISPKEGLKFYAGLSMQRPLR